jgi:hypothetical protein
VTRRAPSVRFGELDLPVVWNVPMASVIRP